MSDELKCIVEAVLMASDAPLSVARIQSAFAQDGQPSAAQITAELRRLGAECEQRGIELRKIGAGYRYQSRRQYAQWIGNLHAARPPKMSRALLETLAIIAYRQPVTRGDIEEIRGVGVSADIMRRLQEREWIKEVGARDLPGRPVLFATTAEFLSYFNLESIKDLPPLAEQRELGEVAGDLDSSLPAELLAVLSNSASPAAGRQGGAAADSTVDSASDSAVDSEVDSTSGSSPAEQQSDQ